MPSFMRFLTSRAAGVAALGATGLMLPRRLPLAAPAEPHEAAKSPKGPPARELRSAEDPHLWLEEIEGEAALEWCKAQNARAVGTVGDPHASESYRKILAIADSKDKIPHVGRIGGRTGDEEVRRDEPFAAGVPSWLTLLRSVAGTGLLQLLAGRRQRSRCVAAHVAGLIPLGRALVGDGGPTTMTPAHHLPSPALDPLGRCSASMHSTGWKRARTARSGCGAGTTSSMRVAAAACGTARSSSSHLVAPTPPWCASSI